MLIIKRSIKQQKEQEDKMTILSRKTPLFKAAQHASMQKKNQGVIHKVRKVYNKGNNLIKAAKTAHSMYRDASSLLSGATTFA